MQRPWALVSSTKVQVSYHGVNAHAAGNPEDGINALDAVIQAFNAIAAMRQQMKQTWRVHGIILKGGTKPNIIPDLTVTEWYAREHQRFLRPAQHGRLRRLVTAVTAGRIRSVLEEEVLPKPLLRESLLGRTGTPC